MNRKIAGNNPPLSAIFGCAGTELTGRERDFFQQCNPLGFILFARNAESPAQVRDLVVSLRETVGRQTAPVLIDQEGGRVQRLRSPHWRRLPPAESFGCLWNNAPEKACRAAWLHGYTIAGELAELGINVNCLPCLDLRFPGAHDIIGDRSFGANPQQVAQLGQAVCNGLLAGSVIPVVKHIPGHGRALVDSHESLPRVEASFVELEESDFLPFRNLASAPWAMTAHVVYQAIDEHEPATTSQKVVQDVIRGKIGFDGLLLSDDISMKALKGNFEDRTCKALSAGCDVVLHCNGQPEEMEAVAKAASPLSEVATQRLEKSFRATGYERLSFKAALDELGALLP